MGETTGPEDSRQTDTDRLSQLAFSELRRRHRVFSRITDARSETELQEVLRSLAPGDDVAIEELRYSDKDEFTDFIKRLRKYDENFADVIEQAGERIRPEYTPTFDTRTAFAKILLEVHLRPETREMFLRVIMRRLRGGDVTSDQTLEDAMWFGSIMISNVKDAMDDVKAAVLRAQAVDLGKNFEKHLTAAEAFLKDIRESYEAHKAASNAAGTEDREPAE